MKRHHVVPQMLLQRFANSSERLVMVSRDEPSRDSITTNIINAAAEAGFYRLPAEDVAPSHRAGHDPEAVERTLAVIEGRARPLLDALAHGELPTWEDRYHISQFLAVQHVRGPDFRADFNRLVTLAARDHLRLTITPARAAALLRQQGKPDSPANARALLESAFGEDGPLLVVSQSYAVLTALEHAFNTVQPLVYFRAWHVLRFPKPVLLTSDAPVAVWSPPAAGGPSVGVANAAETYLPLDRRTALIVTEQHVDDAPDKVITDPPPELAKRINTAVAANAYRWIFHHPEDRPLDGVVLPPPSRWERDIHAVVLEPGGLIRVRGVTVKRPRTG